MTSLLCPISGGGNSSEVPYLQAGGEASGGNHHAPTREGTTVILKEVPAEACENCGEPYVQDGVAGCVLALAEETARKGAEVEILTFTA